MLPFILQERVFNIGTTGDGIGQDIKTHAEIFQVLLVSTRNKFIDQFKIS